MSTTQDGIAEENDAGRSKPEKDDAAPPHPYADQLAQFEPTKEVKDPIKSPKLKDSSVTLVNSQQLLDEMMEKLKTVSELAFDMEYNIFHSFHGVTNFLQISTRTEDFIIDPVTLKDQLSDLILA